MKLIIHRGSREIGGTCIELATLQTTIWLDAGLPLKEEEDIILPMGNPDAIVISHPHQDHFGLLDKLEESIPVYIGEVALDLINAARIFTGRPIIQRQVHFIKKDCPFMIGDFRLLPKLVDHSAVDAFAFEVEADRCRVLYSGDFRGHGRKASLFQEMLTRPPQDIDVMLMEGTMIGRENGDFPDETSVEKAVQSIIREQKNITFVIASSQNIDRWVSVARACMKEHKILVVDIYTAWVLEKLRGISRSIPDISWDEVAVYADYRQDEILKAFPGIFGDFRRRVYRHRIRMADIRSDPSRFVWWTKMSRHRRIGSFRGQKPVNVIYSQWLGYLDRQENPGSGARDIAAFRDDPGVNFHYSHTSGHATVKDLQDFAKAINPDKLIPVHTEHGDKYHIYFGNCLILKDGQPLQV